jgi:hypothetical protein
VLAQKANRGFESLPLRHERQEHEGGLRVVVRSAAAAAPEEKLGTGRGAGRPRVQRLERGEMTERSKVRAWRARVPQKGTVGSNPTLSAIIYRVSLNF